MTGSIDVRLGAYAQRKVAIPRLAKSSAAIAERRLLVAAAREANPGLSAYAIAHQVLEDMVSEDTVCRDLRALGLDVAQAAGSAAGRSRSEERERIVAALYSRGMRTPEITKTIRISKRQVLRLLDRAGVARHQGPVLRKHPEPGTRTCGRQGCDKRFRPKPKQAAAGYGRFCSKACDTASRQGTQPAHLKAATVDRLAEIKKYCSENALMTRASAAARLGRAESVVDYHESIDELSRRETVVAGGQRFVLYAKADVDDLAIRLVKGTDYRVKQHRDPTWVRAWAIAVGHSETAAEQLAQRVKRRNKIGYGLQGGRPPEYTDEQADEARRLKESNPKLGRAAIAARTGLTEDQVRSIFARKTPANQG